jgi:hypothetical protein
MVQNTTEYGFGIASRARLKYSVTGKREGQ